MIPPSTLLDKYLGGAVGMDLDLDGSVVDPAQKDLPDVS